MKALILVDIQRDFVAGGALAVPGGAQVVAVANLAQKKFELIVATRDWHPANHASFAANHPGRKPGDAIELDGMTQVLWPVHCVAQTLGAQFVPGLETARITREFHKGTDPSIDSYSGFFDNGHRKATGLGDYLQSRSVSDVFIMGLATDYCVKFTALDARRLGLRTYVVIDGCRGVDLKPGDSEAAVEAMQKAGAALITSDEIHEGGLP
jgi:nicotinamidase/pyrazinamidase